MYTKDKNCPVDMPHAFNRRAICVALCIALLLGFVGLGLALRQCSTTGVGR